MSQDRKPLPFIFTFTAGAIAGISEILTFYPLDVVKTRMQLERGKAQHGLVGTFKSIVKEEGYAQFSNTVQGGFTAARLVPPLLLEAPKRAVKLLQDKSSTYAGPIDVVKQIVRNDGLLGLYAGMEATFWRHVWWNGGYFGSIFQVKALLPKPETPQGELLNNFISGAVGGFVGTAVNTPFDVVKSRIQGYAKVPGVTPKYNWTYPGIVTIFREEGAAALYKGFVPKVLRLAPGGGVLLLVVEFTLDLFRKAMGPPYI
ncbi:hypothetical protein EW146_g9054 [Bondarzewia mesenterica]|uniref:Mitochondrial carrier n=1 Tax=Bondarzewia mesenterica TaxID=1095465 RepID=A0A4S4LAX2_9AGAM|nr:hypothetical protein EW146_g9054 [Bondarzewia mesenterica]